MRVVNIKSWDESAVDYRGRIVPRRTDRRALVLQSPPPLNLNSKSTSVHTVTNPTQDRRGINSAGEIQFSTCSPESQVFSHLAAPLKEIFKANNPKSLTRTAHRVQYPRIL